MKTKSSVLLLNKLINALDEGDKCQKFSFLAFRKSKERTLNDEEGQEASVASRIQIELRAITRHAEPRLVQELPQNHMDTSLNLTPSYEEALQSSATRGLTTVSGPIDIRAGELTMRNGDIDIVTRTVSLPPLCDDLIPSSSDGSKLSVIIHV